MPLFFRAKNLGIWESQCSLGFLKEMPQLDYTDIENCIINDYSGLLHQKSISVIKIYNTNLTNEDIQYFSNMEKLQVIEIINTNLTDLSELCILNNVEALGVQDNKITDITSIINLKALKEIDLRGNPINNYTPLFECPNLERIFINKGEISTEQIQELTDHGIKVIQCNKGEAIPGGTERILDGPHFFKWNP